MADFDFEGSRLRALVKSRLGVRSLLTGGPVVIPCAKCKRCSKLPNFPTDFYYFTNGSPWVPVSYLQGPVVFYGVSIMADYYRWNCDINSVIGSYDPYDAPWRDPYTTFPPTTFYFGNYGSINVPLTMGGEWNNRTCIWIGSGTYLGLISFYYDQNTDCMTVSMTASAPTGYLGNLLDPYQEQFIFTIPFSQFDVNKDNTLTLTTRNLIVPATDPSRFGFSSVASSIIISRFGHAHFRQSLGGSWGGSYTADRPLACPAGCVDHTVPLEFPLGPLFPNMPDALTVVCPQLSQAKWLRAATFFGEQLDPSIFRIYRRGSIYEDVNCGLYVGACYNSVSMNQTIPGANGLQYSPNADFWTMILSANLNPGPQAYSFVLMHSKYTVLDPYETDVQTRYNNAQAWWHQSPHPYVLRGQLTCKVPSQGKCPPNPSWLFNSFAVDLGTDIQPFSDPTQITVQVSL